MKIIQLLGPLNFVKHMPDYSIRPAKETELAGIVQLLIRIWQEQYRSFLPHTFLDTMDFDRQLQRHKAYFKKGVNYLIVESQQKELLGFCSFGENRDEFPPAKWELYTLYVTPEQQGKGIGKSLLDEMEKYLASGEEVAVWVMKTNPFRHFYEKKGYKWVGERNVDFGGFEVAHWVMKRRIADE